MRDDLRTGACTGTHYRNAATRYRRARRANFFVSANVISVRVRVDDVTNRPVGQLTQRRQDRIGILHSTGIDDDRSKTADLHRDVRPCANDDVDVPLNGHRIQATFTPRRWRRTTLRPAVDVRGQRADHDGSDDDE